MKNFKMYKLLLLTGITITLVGCNSNEHNQYENKETYKIEITQEQTNEKETTKEIENEVSTEVPTQTPTEPQTQAPTVMPTEPQTQTPTVMPTEPQTNIKEETEIPMTDDEVIEFIQRVGTDMNECSEKIFDGAVHGFITVVDFLFYDGTIGGRTFDSLTDEAKGKALALYDEMSIYIEANWPLWKEKIGTVYENAKVLWADKKEDLSGLLESGKQKVKNWYENLKKEHNYN